MRLARYALALASIFAIAGPVGPARAAVTATIVEFAGDVVITGSGTLNITSGTLFGSIPGGSIVGATNQIGMGVPGTYEAYFMAITGPSSFGPGVGVSFASTSAAGDLFGLSFVPGQSGLGVPVGYVSGSPLSGSSTHAGQSLASMGLTPGVYEWTWGSGPSADSFTLTIDGTPPTPTTARILLVGDSWLSQSCGFPFNTALANQGFGQYRAACTETTTPGSTAHEWADPAGRAVITNALNTNPEADIVHLSMGGNDPFYWIGQNVVDPAVYGPQILADIQTVVDHILSVRPWARITIWPYDYTEGSNNAALGAFAQSLIDAAALTPRFVVLNTAGVLHHTFGFPAGAPPFNPGDTPLPGGYPDYIPLLGGDPSQQADPATFADPVHPNTASYIALAEFGIDEFYADWLAPGAISEIINLDDGLDGPHGVAVDASGNVFVAGEISDNVFRISPGGVKSEIINLADGLDGPIGVAVDASGNVFVAGYLSHNVFRITPGGAKSEIINAGDGLGGPIGVAVDASGNVFVAGSASHNVFRITPGGVKSEIINAGDGLGYPNGVAVDASGNVFVAGYFSDNVFRITPGGVKSEIINASDGLDGPFPMAVDASGNVFVAGYLSHNVFRITPGGVKSEIINLGDGLDGPYGVAVDASGNVFVSGSLSDNVFRITPGGVKSEIINLFDVLSGPRGVAVDTSGNVFVAGGDSDNVFRITPGDDDLDGVPSATEQAGPNGGDGNGDGIPDDEQVEVASMPDLGGSDYVTLEAVSGCGAVSNVGVFAEAPGAGGDPAYDYAYGLVSFTLPCPGPVDVKLYFHGTSSLTPPYRKYGPTTPGDANTLAWYNMPGAVFDTETVDGNLVSTVTFTLSDGDLGDATGVDGQIVDPGGPVSVPEPGFGVSLLSGIALLRSLALRRRGGGARASPGARSEPL